MKPATWPGPGRIAALDLLRGLAVGAMLVSGQLPRAVLPGWMYHAQNPPPSHAFTPTLPGLTWVDLVFPVFLFALGAAIPLALAPKLAAGLGTGAAAAAAGVLRRFALLALFAIYARHASPHVAEFGAPWRDACYALACLLALFAILAPLPPGWKAGRAVRLAGWTGAAGLMWLFRDADGAGFSVARSDTILLVLANVALGGGLVYLATRRRPSWRLGVLALLLALRLGHELPGWASWAWQMSPLPWLAPVAFQQYLFVVIPGIWAGEWLGRMAPAPHARAVPAALCCLALVALCSVGLYARAMLGPAALAMLGVGALGIRAMRGQPPQLGRLYALGLCLLLLGLAFDPAEGGTQKGVATLSYYLVGAAAGSLLLLALLLAGPRPVPLAGLWTGAGQNPLFAYVALHLLVTPLLVLSGQALLPAAGPLAGCLRAAALTLLTCALAALALRMRLPFRI